MNCPKCGGELIINSDVCPRCDVMGETPPVEDKKAKTVFLKKYKNFIILVASVLCAAVAVVSVCVYVSHRRISALNNGNRLNGTLVCETGTEYYYSTAQTLFCTNKRFSSTEVIDTAALGNISNIVEANKCIYYTKDNAMFIYNPRSRKKTAVCAAEGEYIVVAKSYYDIYYCHGNALYKFDTKTQKLEKVTDGVPVFYDSDVYLCDDGVIYKTEIDNLQKERIATVSEYTEPVFIKDGRLFCFDYKDPKVFSVSVEDGSVRDEFNPQNYENISDVTHINISRGYMFIRGENGIYRYDFDTNEALLMTSVGFKEYINVYSSGIYAVSENSDFCFADFDGKIQFQNE